MSGNKQFGGIGACSILMIFVVLCLTTFGLLSLVSARADLRLSQEARLSAERYYAADAQTDLTLSQIDQVLADLRANGGISSGAFAQHAAVRLAEIPAVVETDGRTALITAPMGERQFLRTTLTLLPNGAEQRYRVESRRVITEILWEEEVSEFAEFPGQ
jgi:hypothetical protein